MKIPVIGITLDSEEKDCYSKFPWYAVRENYMDALSHAGGLPIALPYNDKQIGEYMHLIDGLLLTGCAFDIDPNLF